MKKIILFFISLLPALHLNALEVIQSELPNINQLPTKEILCIFQDSEGYMWYGTEGGGLCRDDGYSVNVFRSDFNTPELLASNSITCITEDREGRIWFGSKRGVYILDKKDYQITPLADDDIKKWVIRMINATSEGSVWVSSEGHLFRYNLSGERIGHYEVKWSTSPRAANTLFEAEDGTIWLLQWRNGLFRYDPQQDDFIKYAWSYKSQPTCMVKDDSSPDYWIGTWDGGIVRFNPNDKDINKMFSPQSCSNQRVDLNKEKIYRIIQDKVNHNLWIITADNLYAYEIKENNT